MATKNKNGGVRTRWLNLGESLKTGVPQVYAAVTDEEEFRELRLKLRDDGTVLAILKAYGSDGGKMVCFGSGYGVAGALLALDSTIAANGWKVDKPWRPGKE